MARKPSVGKRKFKESKKPKVGSRDQGSRRRREDLKLTTQYYEIYYQPVDRGATIEHVKRERPASSRVQEILKYTLAQWIAGKIEFDFVSREDSMFMDRIYRFSTRKKTGRLISYTPKEEAVEMKHVVAVKLQPPDRHGVYEDPCVRVIGADGSKGEIDLVYPKGADKLTFEEAA